MKKWPCAIGVTAALLASSTVSAGTIRAQKPYQSFGNLAGVGDCGYESDANLILHEWPKARITTPEVERAYQAYGNEFAGQSVTSDGGQNWTLTGLWEAQLYLISTGFAGHRASSIVQIDQVQVPAATQGGGVEVVNDGPVRQHVFDIIAANATHVVIVDDGFVYHYTWTWLNYAYTQDGETLTYYGVTW